MADYNFISMAESPKVRLFVEPSPVTADNVAVLCDSLIFAYPRKPEVSSVNLIKCVKKS